MALQLPQIVEIRQHGKVLAVAALELKGGRIRAVGAGGRPTSIPIQRVLCATGVAVPDEAIAVAQVEQYEREQHQRLADVDTLTLWELASEARWRTTSLAELAGLLDPDADGRTAALVLRAVITDDRHFKVRADDVLVHTADEVEAAAEREHEARRRQAVREATVAWLKGEADEAPDGSHRLVDAVRSLAAQPNQPPAKDRGVALLREAGLKDTPAGAFRVLVRRGVFEPDQNLLRIRYGMERPFSAKVRAQAEDLAEAALDLSDREDLRHLTATAVDDPGTTEIDDALSLQPREDGGWQVGVHLADPAALIPLDSDVDRAAARRQTTLYLPRGKRLMIPSCLSEAAASLLPDRDRPALSVLIDLDAAGARLGARICRSVVRIDRCVSYEQVDEALESSADWRTLTELAEGLRDERIARGALDTRLPEVNPRVNADGTVELWVVEAASRARAMVAEWMVRANEVAAHTLFDARVPAMYRCQDLKHPLPEDHEPADRHKVYRATRCLGQTLLEAVPRPHAGLGLDAYVQFTSPLRRYLDLITQRQLGALLAGAAPPLDAEALAAVVARAQPVLSHAQIVRGGTRQYWLTRWLEQHVGDELDAVVLDRVGKRLRIDLVDLSWRRLYRPPRRVEPGQRVRLRVRSADARADEARFELLDDPG